MQMQSNSRFGEQGYEEQGGWSETCREMTATAIDDYPLSTAIGVFAVGLSVGLCIGAALSRPMQPQHRRIAESLGRRILDAVQEYAPASVQQYLPR